VYSPTQLIVAGIPAYNEEKNIAKVILKAQTHADKIVVVDDGSKDYTTNIAEKLGAIVVRHETNLGYGAAIKSCFLAARDLDADILVTIDADDQHNPEDIPKVVGPILSGEYDVVIG
jgi:glycosyltransferase involved in cell wall biosynthesis